MQIPAGTLVEIFNAPTAISTLEKPPPVAELELPVSDTKLIAKEVDYEPELSLKAMNALFEVGADMQDIANALRRTMRTVIEDRPDLRSAKFDFETDNGKIKLISDDISADDRNWLEGLLNKNWDLRDALSNFHADYIDLYRGRVGSKVATEVISQRVDKSVQLMSLLSQLGSDTQRTLIRSEGTFQRIDGGPLDLSQGAETAEDFLSYVEQMDKIREGSISFTTRKGKVYYDAYRASNPYIATGFMLQKTLYDDKSISLGFYEKA
jgi:hypothetical protein